MTRIKLTFHIYFQFTLLTLKVLGQECDDKKQQKHEEKLVKTFNNKNASFKNSENLN